MARGDRWMAPGLPGVLACCHRGLGTGRAHLAVQPLVAARRSPASPGASRCAAGWGLCKQRARSGGPGERRVAAAGEAGFASRDKYLQARPCTPLGRLGALNIDYSNGKFSSRALFGLSHVKAGMGGAPVGESALGFSPRPVLLPRRGPSLRLVYCPPAVGLKRCEAEPSPCPRQRTGVAVGWAPACVSGSLPPLPG